MGPDPAVAAIRRAIRQSLAGHSHQKPVFVACSGGADSLALALCSQWVAARDGWKLGALIVDHQWDPHSGERCADVARQLQARGFTEVEVLAVDDAGATGANREAKARQARYQALAAAAHRHGSTTVLVGHTSDDQAETVLLRLTRGSGARSLAGMPAKRGVFLRPLLELTRAQTQQACQALGAAPWGDPANDDPAFLRSRVRGRVLPVMQETMGPGVRSGLVTTARLLRADADYLDFQAAQVWTELEEQGQVGWVEPHLLQISCPGLSALPAAMRWRVIRRACLAVGADGGALQAEHVWSVDALVKQWSGQKEVFLPSGATVRRVCGTLTFVTHDPATVDPHRQKDLRR